MIHVEELWSSWYGTTWYFMTGHSFLKSMSSLLIVREGDMKSSPDTRSQLNLLISLSPFSEQRTMLKNTHYLKKKKTERKEKFWKGKLWRREKDRILSHAIHGAKPMPCKVELSKPIFRLQSPWNFHHVLLLLPVKKELNVLKMEKYL